MCRLLSGCYKTQYPPTQSRSFAYVNSAGTIFLWQPNLNFEWTIYSIYPLDNPSHLFVNKRVPRTWLLSCALEIWILRLQLRLQSPLLLTSSALLFSCFGIVLKLSYLLVTALT